MSVLSSLCEPNSFVQILEIRGLFLQIDFRNSIFQLFLISTQMAGHMVVSLEHKNISFHDIAEKQIYNFKNHVIICDAYYVLSLSCWTSLHLAQG